MAEMPTLDLACAERRRAGRTDVDAALVPLFRGVAVPDGHAIDSQVADTHDDLAVSRGIVLMLLLAVPLWAAVWHEAVIALH